MPLTDLKVRALKPYVRPRRYSDGGNMYLEVKPNGSKLWLMAYSFAGKQKTLACGIYPETSLAEARERRSEAKSVLRGGIDPIEHAREVAAQRQAEFGNPFSDIAKELLEKNRREGLAETTLSKKAWLIAIANRDIGDKPIARLKPVDAPRTQEASARPRRGDPDGLTAQNRARTLCIHGAENLAKAAQREYTQGLAPAARLRELCTDADRLPHPTVFWRQKATLTAVSRPSLEAA